jgi:hypothetical protein
VWLVVVVDVDKISPSSPNNDGHGYDDDDDGGFSAQKPTNELTNLQVRRSTGLETFFNKEFFGLSIAYFNPILQLFSS